MLLKRNKQKGKTHILALRNSNNIEFIINFIDRVCFIMSLGFKFTIKRLFLNAFKIGTSVGAPQQPLHHNQPRRSLCIQRYNFTSERVTWQRILHGLGLYDFRFHNLLKPLFL